MIDAFYLYYILLSSLSILFTLPLIILNIIFLPIVKLVLKQDFSLYTSGVKIKKKYIEWKKIKSISFQTGRLKSDEAFFRGFKLPVLQRIFVLDKDGKEYSCIIDIDYYSKTKREDNNLRKIRELLLGMDRISLLSDWAEKR